MCLANSQSSWWSRDHFSLPSRDLYLPNAWSQALQTSKRHTFTVWAFHRYHWFGVKLFFCSLCAGYRTGTTETRKTLFWILLRPRYKIPEFFMIAPVFTSTLTVCRRNRGDPSSMSVALRVRHKYPITKTELFSFGLEPPTRRSQCKSAHKCTPYNNSVQNFIQIGWDLAVWGPKTCFE